MTQDELKELHELDKGWAASVNVLAQLEDRAAARIAAMGVVVAILRTLGCIETAEALLSAKWTVRQ